jgi:integrase
MARDLITSDKTIKAVREGDERKRLSDGDGLYLLLFVKGSSHGWRLDYTHAGRRKTLSLGTYPDTGLALARRKAQEARELLAQGLDPSAARKAAKVDQVREIEIQAREDAGLPAEGSFEAVAREWLHLVHGVKTTPSHADRTRIRLEQDVFPWIGRRPISEIKPPELLECIRRVEGRGARETAHRIRYVCGQVFRYGIATDRCVRDSAADLKDALASVTVRHHAAITDPARVGELLRAIEAYKGHGVTRAALALAPHVFQRPGELRMARWEEIDLDAATWTIPSERMKRRLQQKESGAPHLVPLSTQAVAILRDLQPLTSHSAYLFPSLRTRERPMSDAAVLAALRRMGFPKDEMTGHGFRAMARTLLAERLNVKAEVIEAQLAHGVADALGRAYNRTQFVEQRRKMMQAWSDYLDRLRKGADILPMKRPSR